MYFYNEAIFGNAEINYEQGTFSIRVLQRNISGQRGFSNALCLFCEKVDKNQKGSRTREPFIVCADLRADDKIRRKATEKSDERILQMKMN